MLILGWLIVGLIMGFLFHGFSDDASRSSCGPSRWSPYRSTLAATSSTCVPMRPGLVGTPAWKQERDDPWRRTPPTRKCRILPRRTGAVQGHRERDREPAQGEIGWGTDDTP